MEPTSAFLLGLLAILQLADILTTMRFLRAGVPEANPVLRQLFEEVGPVRTLVFIKMVFLYLAYVTIGEPFWDWIMGGFCVVYSWVVVHNWRAVR